MLRSKKFTYLIVRIYIHEERQDTVIYKYHSKPIICPICQIYRHTKKWCKSEEKVCRKILFALRGRAQSVTKSKLSGG